MQRRDFRTIAAIVRRIESPHDRKNTAIDLAVYLATKNPKFNFATFYKACGIDVTVKCEVF